MKKNEKKFIIINNFNKNNLNRKMKLTGNLKFNLPYLFLLLILGTQLISIANSKTSRVNNKNHEEKKGKKQKFRGKGEICYHSVPLWEEKHGNLPCEKGYICRPPIKKGKAKKTDIPYRCYKDNKKGREGNIQFATKKQRESEDSFLFTIDVKNKKKVKKTGRESTEWQVTLVDKGMDCDNPNGQGFKEKQCKPGHICFKGGMSKYTCHVQENAKADEVCYQSLPTFVPKKCPNGYECKGRPQDRGMTGVGSYCLKAAVSNSANANEVCFNSTPNFQPKTCPTGYECRFKRAELSAGMTGISKYCLKPESDVAQEGEVCFEELVKNFEKKRCADPSLSCTLLTTSAHGAKKNTTWRCIRMGNTNPDVAKEGDICSDTSKPNWHRKCADSSLECLTFYTSAHGAQNTGIGRCTKKGGNSGNTNQIEEVGEGQVCNKPIPNFTPKKCTAGLVCRVKESQKTLSGVSAYCFKPSSDTKPSDMPITIGGKCGGNDPRGCPSGHICKQTIGDKQGSTYCLMPSMLDKAGYKPFVGLNNYCDTATKPCSPGSTCRLMFDGSRICVANSLSAFIKDD